ncbi:MAG: GNAT family N-acetyltransferase [Candidatus Heimdallarchaeota archaeon]|nr:MAG: GNAT family N-acetyltransferase [Candidatus Heimdallarchaeota archaeon]
MVQIRKYQPKDRDDVINICWKTGYMGDDSAGHFDDRYLFGLLFCLYYVDYEPENCFVAVDEDRDKAIGYVLSSLNSEKQEKQFRKKIIPKIIRRAFLYTIWRYHRTFRVFWHFKKTFQEAREPSHNESLLAPYPAHLHIDILPQYHRQGVGTKLMRCLESHFRTHNVKGAHLGTSEKNEKAIPFYKKLGYSVIYEGPSGYGMWPDAPEVRELILAKKYD